MEKTLSAVLSQSGLGKFSSLETQQKMQDRVATAGRSSGEKNKANSPHKSGQPQEKNANETESRQKMEPEVTEPECTSAEDIKEPVVGEKTVRRCCYKCPFTVEVITFGLFLVESLSASVTTNFILVKTCEVHFHFNKSICAKLENSEGNATDIESLVQPYSAVIFAGMSFLSIFLPAIMTLFVGPWSDYNGRKPVLIVSALGYFLKFVLLWVFAWIPNIDPRFGLVAILPVAFTGGIINFITAAYSYISDITKDDNRAFRISVLESFLYSSNIVGLLSASYIFKACAGHAYVVTFGLCAAVMLTVTVITYIFVPESVQSTENGRGVWHVFEMKLFRETLSVCFKRREGYRRAVIFLSIISIALSISVGIGESNVLFLYTRLRFGWNVEDFTLWASVISATDFFGLLLGSLVFSKWLKLSDAVVGVLSYLNRACNAFYVAFLPPGASKLMYYAGLIGMFGGLCGPASRAVLSKSVPQGDLGKVFALTGLSEAVLPLAVGPLYTFIYNFTLNKFPSTFIHVSGSLLVCAGVFFVIIYFAQKSELRRMEKGEGKEDPF